MDQDVMYSDRTLNANAAFRVSLVSFIWQGTRCFGAHVAASPFLAVEGGTVAAVEVESPGVAGALAAVAP